MLKKPWLYLPPHLSYFLSEKALDFYTFCLSFKEAKPPLEWRPVKWKDLYFPNPLGIAGGLDKNGKHIKAWQVLGAGFAEVGTLTPLLQKPNPRPRLRRWNQEQVLWNHLGFPNQGAKTVCQRLKQWKQKQDCLKHQTGFPVFANISKNKNTPMKGAEKDFLHCIDLLYPYVDGFVINISSPNTKNLRQLCHPEKLKPLLRILVQKLKSLPDRRTLPLLVKWGPDATEKQFLLSFDTALKSEVQGHILCNSTQKREFCLKNHKPLSGTKTDFPAPKWGGLSGSVLTQASQNLLSLAVRHLGEAKNHQLLISAGGVLSPEEVFYRLHLGADLVQVYSAVVFKGPGFFRKTAQFMRQLERKPDSFNKSAIKGENRKAETS